MNKSTVGKGEWLNPVADSAWSDTAIELEEVVDTWAGVGDCVEWFDSEVLEDLALVVCHIAEPLGRILICSLVRKLKIIEQKQVYLIYSPV